MGKLMFSTKPGRKGIYGHYLFSFFPISLFFFLHLFLFFFQDIVTLLILPHMSLWLCFDPCSLYNSDCLISSAIYLDFQFLTLLYPILCKTHSVGFDSRIPLLLFFYYFYLFAESPSVNSL